ncbi:hypothetical protein [Pantoea ananatis]|uniref:hypothetical protein n=1 Tax=Pantoea ananas TaxID=553 RepID=UPI000CF42C28|nr:hypothetical protein [Pantoea ananatis]PQK75918.1 hypothetical protein CG430_13090 [Pantoea ananatis]
MDQNHYCYFPLNQNEAVRYWQLSAISSQRYDVPNAPMSGEMDPFFFLSQHKNFIPHTYPCRTQFQQHYAGKKPTPFGDTTLKNWWFPFGSDRVDLSGFWFRATRIGAQAETYLVAEQRGLYRFRLTTCGAACITLNGGDVAWQADYQRNLESTVEFALMLDAGVNAIAVWFDDLAERDVRFFFQLDYVEGAPLQVALATPIEADRVRQMEALLEGMAFEQPTYTGGTVRLCFPIPAPETLNLNIRVQGDFISLDQPVLLNAVLHQGETVAEIAESDPLPADFRHFVISMEKDNFHIRRTLGVEICHAEQQAQVPKTADARADEALMHVALHGEYSSVKALARLACGRDDTETQNMLEGVLTPVEECHDCADFTLVPLLWCRIQWADRIAAPVREKMDRAILAFRYWMDEPGNDVQWYFSENHALLFHTAAYLAGSTFPDKTFVRSGRLGYEQAEAGSQRVLAWLDHFEQCEMAEWNSAPYFPIDLKGLTALAALAPDADIVARSQRAILRLLEQIARSSHQGMLTASQGRSYEHTLRAGRSLELSAISRLLWGKGNVGCRFHALPQLALLLKQGKLTHSPELAKVAVWRGDSALEWYFAQGLNRIARLYHYKTRDVAMGSLAGYRWGEWGYQETPIHLRIGETPEAQIWINHPGERLHSGFGRPSYWGGCGTLPRVQQYRGLAIVLFRVHEGQPDFSHAWLPQRYFDDVRCYDKRILLRSGKGMVQISGNRAFQRIAHGPTQHCEVRLPGQETCWLIRLNDDPRLDNLADFEARFAQLTVERREDGTFYVNDPQYGEVFFQPNGCVFGQGRLLDPDSWTISGDSHELPL